MRIFLLLNIILNILFWSNYLSTEKKRIPCTLHPVSANGYIFHNYSAMAISGNWHRDNVCMSFYPMLQICVTTITIKIQNYSITITISCMLPLYSYTRLSVPHHSLPLLNTSFSSSLLYCYFENAIWMQSSNMWPFEIGFFSYWAEFPWDLFKLLHVSSSVFLMLSGIPWCGCITVCLTIHLLRYIWVVSGCLLLQIKLLRTIMSRFFCGPNFHFSGINSQECDCWVIW